MEPEAQQYIGTGLGRSDFGWISCELLDISNSAWVGSRRSFTIFVWLEGKCVDEILQLQHYEKNLFAY